MKLPSGHSIGSFYTSHFISIIGLSITSREDWNLILVDESERNTANFIWVISRGSVPCYFTDVSWQLTNQIARDCCADVRGWSVSCREIGIEFQSNRVWWFPLWGFYENFAWKYTFSKIDTPPSQESFHFTLDVTTSRFARSRRNAFRREKDVHVKLLRISNQTWRPFILRMLWLQYVWLCAEQLSDKMQTVELVPWLSLVFVLGQEWIAKIVNFAQYLREFQRRLPRCECSYFLAFW